MNRNILPFLCCPKCSCALELTTPGPLNEVQTRSGDPASESEIESGLLQCVCGASYPIVNGVPRFVGTNMDAAKVTEQFTTGAAGHDPPSGQREGRLHSPQGNNDYEHIRKSFSREWQLFDYTGDKTWGWTLEERKRIFLDDMGLAENEVRGQLLLDAGCGNGTLTASLATLGMRVVGIDLNDGLGIINSSKRKFAGQSSRNVQFVQGNLVKSPFRQRAFDLIYCSGVIHHTPNPKLSFSQLVPLVKRGGRLYVWVYGHRSLVVRAFFGSGRQLKKFMSLESLLRFCRTIAPAYSAATKLLNSVGIMSFRERTVRETTLDLFDAFAPRYNHYHTADEVKGWFKEMGFRNITVSGRQKHGFGVYGDKL